MSGYVPKKVTRGKKATKTNQIGLKMSGSPSRVGRQGKISRYIHRRSQDNQKYCGPVYQYGAIWNWNNLPCVTKAPRIGAPQYRRWNNVDLAYALEVLQKYFNHNGESVILVGTKETLDTDLGPSHPINLITIVHYGTNSAAYKSLPGTVAQAVKIFNDLNLMGPIQKGGVPQLHVIGTASLLDQVALHNAGFGKRMYLLPSLWITMFRWNSANLSSPIPQEEEEEEATYVNTLIAEHVGTKKYVTSAGDDSNDGSEGAPWLTPRHAMNTSASGTMIIISSGTYRFTCPGTEGWATDYSEAYLPKPSGTSVPGVGQFPYSNGILHDTDTDGTAKELSIVGLNPGQVILEGVRTSTFYPSEFHHGTLRHQNSYAFGLILKRENAGKIHSANNACAAYHSGEYDLKGRYINCVFEEVDLGVNGSNGRMSLVFDRFNNAPVDGSLANFDNCTFVYTTFQESNTNYPESSNTGTLLSSASSTGAFNTATFGNYGDIHNLIESGTQAKGATFNATTYAITAGGTNTTSGVYGGAGAWTST